jgi:hypothetical protein
MTIWEDEWNGGQGKGKENNEGEQYQNTLCVHIKIA